MPKKLTMVGVLAALALGAVALFQGAGTTYAGPGGKIQNFHVSSSICYGAPPVAGGTCAPGTDTTAVAGTQYTAITLVKGSRLTLPVQYTPSAFTYTAPGDGTTIGTITSKTDILCDGAEDILSAGGGASPTGNPNDPNLKTGLESGAGVAFWPDPTIWKGFPSKYFTARPAYISQVKPAPATYGALAYERAEFYTLWLGGASPLDLYTLNGGVPTPLDVIYDTLPGSYPAPAGLRVSAALLSAAPNPPSTSFATCLDSPQDSVSTTTTTSIPAAPGMYARWTVYTSAEDIRSGQVARVIDLNCTTVGPALVDADGDCLPSGTDPNDGAADADGDLVVDGIEAAFGTSRTVADVDADGVDDLVEMMQFTNPTAGDTDGDGSSDLGDDGADETPATKSTIQDTAADDNCPADANPGQENIDSGLVPFTANDTSNAHQDLQGDACDDDDDNDDMSDVAEGGNKNNTGGGGSFCAPTGTDNFTDDQDNDSDNDIGLDGLECKFGTNPNGALSQIGGLGGDALGDGAEENFYKTQKINKPGGGQEDDIDGDGLNGDADSDSDNDRIRDGIEVKFIGTEPGNNDSDQDLCTDGREIADINGDRAVTVTDLQQVASFTSKVPTGIGSGAGRYRSSTTGMVTPSGTVPNGETFINYDMDKNGFLNVQDLQFVAPFTATTPQYVPDGASPGNLINNNTCTAQGDRGVLGTFEAIDGFSVTYSNVVPVVEP